jgi:hypothetical protein
MAPVPPAAWNKNVAITTRANANGSVILILSCFYECFDWLLHVDIFYDTSRGKCIQIFGSCDGWVPLREFPNATQLFGSTPEFETVLPIPIPSELQNGNDPNDRNEIEAFKWVVRKAPAVNQATHPILVRITSPRTYDDCVVDGLLRFLGLSSRLWQSKWRDSKDSTKAKKKLTLVVEPTTDTVWRDTVEINVDWVHTTRYYRDDMFSCEARGYFTAAAFRFLFGRTFPFLIRISEILRQIEKASLMCQVHEAFENVVVPSVSIDAVTYRTREDVLMHESMGNLPELERLYHSQSLPQMQYLRY